MDVIVYLGGGAAALLALGALLRGIWALNRRLVVILDAVGELAPDGGESVRDVVTRTEAKVDQAAAQLKELECRFERHLSATTF